MGLDFFKLDGAGNDFVGLDRRRHPRLSQAEAAQLARELCDRHHGVGGDGLLLLEPAEPASGQAFRMRYFNSDGSLAEMCGNGARCMAVMAARLGAGSGRFRFGTDAGAYEAELAPGGSRIHFPDIAAKPSIAALHGPLKPSADVHFLVAGVPHAVVFVEDIDLLDVETAGREIRFDPAWGAAGANANFAEEIGGMLHLRTYERGVEGETQACGTGAIAAACCWAHRAGLTGRVEIGVVPTGRIPLGVAFNVTPEGFSGISLSGPARIAFTGSWEPAG